MHSQEIDKLADALAKAQLEMESAKMDSTNPHFRSSYADMASVVRASRPHLAKHGLAVVQCTSATPDGVVTIKTMLMHSSGQWISSDFSVKPAKTDMQGIGSAITYARRYCYSSLVGITSSNDDDDGEAAVGRAPEAPRKISAEQLAELNAALEGHDDIRQLLLAKHSSLSSVSADRFGAIMNHVKVLIQKKATDVK